ncbi:hypothetical protein ACFQV2_28335 [Actinokineospora soli]|uniref:Cell division protein FtsL n=1 Tax=Actinokineospora soli TaxID=1048753 RepID=A0ABW2TUW5_9PSEU
MRTAPPPWPPRRRRREHPRRGRRDTERTTRRGRRDADAAGRTRLDADLSDTASRHPRGAATAREPEAPFDDLAVPVRRSQRVATEPDEPAVATVTEETDDTTGTRTRRPRERRGDARRRPGSGAGARADAPARPERGDRPGRLGRARAFAAERVQARRDKVERRAAGEPEAELAAKGRASFVVAIIALLVVGVATTLWLSTQAIADSYRLEAAKEEVARLAEEAAVLQREVSRMESAPELARRARELGMVPAGDPAWLVVGKDGKVRVVGEPTPVQPPPPPPRPRPPRSPPRKPGRTAAARTRARAAVSRRPAATRPPRRAATGDLSVHGLQSGVEGQRGTAQQGAMTHGRAGRTGGRQGSAAHRTTAVPVVRAQMARRQRAGPWPGPPRPARPRPPLARERPRPRYDGNALGR